MAKPEAGATWREITESQQRDLVIAEALMHVARQVEILAADVVRLKLRLAVIDRKLGMR